MPDSAPAALISPLQLRPVVWTGRLLFAVVLLHGVYAVAVYDRLPPRLPVHFGFDGAADAWASPGPGSWFALVLVSAATALAIGLAALAMFRIPPRWLNLPRKAAFLELPEAERRAVLGIVAAFTLAIGATVCAGLFAVHLIQGLVAVGAVTRFPIAAPFAATGAVFVELIAMFIRVSAAVDAATARRIRKREVNHAP